jgi:hypothetical protein
MGEDARRTVAFLGPEASYTHQVGGNPSRSNSGVWQLPVLVVE